jgi:hypothetical protein
MGTVRRYRFDFCFLFIILTVLPCILSGAVVQLPTLTAVPDEFAVRGADTADGRDVSLHPLSHDVQICQLPESGLCGPTLVYVGSIASECTRTCTSARLTPADRSPPLL